MLKLISQSSEKTQLVQCGNHCPWTFSLLSLFTSEHLESYCEEAKLSFNNTINSMCSQEQIHNIESFRNSSSNWISTMPESICKIP